MNAPTLIDTTPLRDQRSMVDVTHPDGLHETIEQVEQAWERWAAREGLPTRRRTGDMSTDLRTSSHPVEPHVTAGKWIASCPNCNDGIACWPFHERGCCLGCGTIYPVFWNVGEDTIQRAVAALRIRPVQDQWWRPDLGETVEILEAENDVQGYGKTPVEKALVSIADLEDALGPKGVQKLRDRGLI